MSVSFLQNLLLNAKAVVHQTKPSVTVSVSNSMHIFLEDSVYDNRYGGDMVVNPVLSRFIGCANTINQPFKFSLCGPGK